MKSQEVKITSQHQITIPKHVCDQLQLKGGDRLEIVIMPNKQLLLKIRKLIDANDPAYLLGQQILEAEKQIRKGQTVPWSEVKRRHKL